MKPDRWRQIEDLYHAALELDRDERARLLDRACAGDDALRKELESLLAYESRAEDFIESPAIELAASLLAKDQMGSEAGKKIGPYEVLSLLAAGGMGEVYLAEDTRLDRKVALKLLPKEYTQDQERLKRFEREARAASALNHPNILTIYDIGRVDGIQYIATEFIEGRTLRQQVAAGKMDLQAALDAACQIASALSAAHAAGIVHRDIKPENIMIRRDGYVKVLDFGLAKLAKPRGLKSSYGGPASDVSTEAGVVLGTVHYMSPEQARGQELDARTDIFSFGVALYEMVAGRAPFEGATSADVIASILAKEPPALARFATQGPDQLEWIINKALRKDRDERYQTAKEMLSDLKSLKRRLEFEEELGRSTDGESKTVEVASGPKASGAKSRASDSRRVIDSLAILPLANTSADPSMEYFSDGITESIINAVSRLPELRVMAWSAVSRYKNRQVDPREVGRNLGVRAALTGRVIQLGERLAIKMELADASDGSHLWSESYVCKPSDILEVEAEISKEISEKLLLRLTSEERRRLAKRYTNNTQAYHAYLKGRHFWNKRTDEGVRQGIEYFNQAIDSDPSYALAYAGLADSYVILGSFGIATLAPAEAYPKAREAALRALEIDDALAEAHASLGMSLASYYWDWPAAEREFKQSILLKPGYATARHWHGFVCMVAMGLLDEAILEVKKARELDPLSLGISTDFGLLLYLARQYDRAIDEYRKTLEIDPNFVYSRWKLGLAYEQKGMYKEAIAELQKAIALCGRSLLPMAQLGRVYAVSGKRDEALAVIEELNELSKQSYVSPYRIAAIYAGLGEKKRAFEWLERAYRERDVWLIWLRFDPVLDSLRSDRRFRNLSRKVVAGGGPAPTEALEPTEILSPVKRPVGATASSRQAPARNRTLSNRALSNRTLSRQTLSRRPSRRAISSLAILPLANTCDDPDMEYFSDGITETIINTLSQFPRLRVVARATVFRYKDKDIDPQEVGRLLGAQAALTGRVRQIADRLIISAELIDVESDSQLWGETYNRNLSDIFEVQEEIAKEIIENLRLKLNRKEKGKLAKRPTRNVEAYQHYLKGRYYWNKRTIESLNKGIEYFRKAIDLDPSYPSAYAGLSDSYTLLVVREAAPPAEGFAKAKAAAAMALKIDEEFAEAHASLGHAMLHNWEWDEAEKELKRAIELNPGYPSAHHWHSELLTAMGRRDESIAELKLAAELDPLSLIISADLGRAFYYARDYDQVAAQEAKTLEMDSNFWLSHINLGRAYIQKGMHEEAIGELEHARGPSASNTETLSFLGFAYAAAGKTKQAMEILSDLAERAKRSHVPPYHFAVVHAGLGENDQAYEWLERSFEKRAVDLFTLKVEPMFDGLRRDPRFENLLRRMGLAQPTDKEKNSTTVCEPDAEKINAQAAPKSIAALPFRPINSEARDEHLELGIADALITKLSNLGKISVRPTVSVQKYIDLDLDPVSAGRELAVESVLEGSIQKIDDRIRVTARLVRVEDGRSLWAGKFDENFTDIFAVEDSISEKVAAALALKLTLSDKERLAKRYTENVEAYEAYLKGRYCWNKRLTRWIRKGVEHFQRAIDLDPTYAWAYAGLCDSYTLLVTWESLEPADGFAKAKAAAKMALEIDDHLPEAHAGLAHALLHTWEWNDAERAFKRAIELNPHYASARQWYAELLAAQGRFSEAIREALRARELDPLSLSINADVGWILYYARRYDEAIEQFKRAIEGDPDFWLSHFLLGQAYTEKSMHKEAIVEFHRAMELSGKGPLSALLVGHAYAASGNRDEALAVVDKLDELSKQRYFSPYRVALIHAGLGNSEEAFEWLGRAYVKRDARLIWLRVDPALDSLRSDLRFQRLLDGVGLS